MTITVGQLRTFCQEEASKDSSGSTSENAFMHWINGALGRLYREIQFDTTRREKRITVPPAESVVDGTVTQNSLALASATGFTAKWLSERWGLHIEDEDRLEFELAAIAAGTPGVAATMRAGDEWIQANGVDKTYTFTKNKLLLTAVQTLEKVQLLDGRIVPIAQPHEFDMRKQEAPCHRGEFPTVCTLRNSYLEIWPSPGTAYYKLIVTYRMAFTPIDDAELDATAVEWDDDQLDVLKKAIMLEAALSQGTNSPVPYPTAKMEFEEALLKLRAVATKDMVPGPLNVHTPIMPRPRGRRSLPPRSALEDI